MQLTFSNVLWYWRGPSPFYFVSVPKPESARISELKRQLTYGWGVIPVTARIGKTEWTTSLIPKDGLYLVPVKNLVRFGEDLELDDEIEITLEFALGGPAKAAKFKD